MVRDESTRQKLSFQNQREAALLVISVDVWACVGVNRTVLVIIHLAKMNSAISDNGGKGKRIGFSNLIAAEKGFVAFCPSEALGLVYFTCLLSSLDRGDSSDDGNDYEASLRVLDTSDA